MCPIMRSEGGLQSLRDAENTHSTRWKPWQVQHSRNDRNYAKHHNCNNLWRQMNKRTFFINFFLSSATWMCVGTVCISINADSLTTCTEPHAALLAESHAALSSMPNTCWRATKKLLTHSRSTISNNNIYTQSSVNIHVHVIRTVVTLAQKTTTNCIP